MTTTRLQFAKLAVASLSLLASASAAVNVQSSYSQDFNSIGTALPEGWAVWINSTDTGNGTAFTWSTDLVANNATANSDNYFRNVPGASQTWTPGLSAGDDRALGWRAGNAGSRDGSITFSFNNTESWSLTALSFQIFTPNNAGTAGTFALEYQIGDSGTFTQLGEVSYTSDTAQNPLQLTTISLSALDLAPLGNQSQQVTLRLNNTAATGTTFQSVAIDNFTYSAVPEPASAAAVVGTAGLAFAGLRRRAHD